MQKLSFFNPKRFTRKRLALGALVIVLAVGAYFFLNNGSESYKKSITLGTLNVFQKVSKLLPLEADTKKEIEVANTLAQKLSATDDVQRTYLVLLQNNHELRPGGGFLGQYAILKIKNGELTYSFVEDANLLDQRIIAKVAPPWPLTRQMQIKRWKFRDSNFSPDFPTNAEKAQYFYRLAGGHEQFDAVIAINADVFNHIFTLTGPVELPGYGTYTSENATLKLEEQVERAYLAEDVPAELKQNRKIVMKRLAGALLEKLVTLRNIPRLAEFAQTELRDKNIMLWFKDPALQALGESVHWDGRVSKDWGNDYLMIVDANLGALKSDYYVKRSLEYTVNFTGEHPIATVVHKYNHTATHGDWRTSDYHTYTRVLATAGSTYIEGSRVKTGGVQTTEGFSKTIFGYKVDAIMGRELVTSIAYQLPDTITPANYQLLIQKQSGVGNIPVTVKLITTEGETVQQTTLAKDLKLVFTTAEEKK